MGVGPPLDLRKLSYFVAVAEELHFGRAADRLYITQPVLSRQIRRLEQELDAELFVRTSRSVVLTEAGAHLLEESRALLASADAARRRLQGIAGGHATLTVGFFGGDEFTNALRRFAAARPEAEVHLHRMYWHDQVELLHDGRVDVAFVHLPIDEHGLELLPVRREPRVAVLAASHPAACREEIGIDDLADEPMISHRSASDAWQAFHNVDPRPDGRHPRLGPQVDNLEEKLELVAAGTAISVVPASVAATYVKPGVVYVPITDIPPIQICLAWKADRRSELVDTFVGAVRATTSAAGGATGRPGDR